LTSELVDREIVNEVVSPAIAQEPPTWLGELQPPYISPVFYVYTDMKDLLLVDPIHEVDVSGWTHQPEIGTTDPK
jgi:hypothetical protein